MSTQPRWPADSEDIPPPPADPRLAARSENIGRLLTTEEIELIHLRDSAYGGSWEKLAHAIRGNTSLPPAARTADLCRVAFLKAYEEQHQRSLKLPTGQPPAGPSRTGDRTT